MIEGGGLGRHEPEDVGPIDVQDANGVVDLRVADEAAAVAAAKRYLSLLPRRRTRVTAPDQDALRGLIPDDRKRIYDVRAVIDALDRRPVSSCGKASAPGIVTALARVEGRPLGIVANNPAHLGGAIDAPAADKAARFLAALRRVRPADPVPVRHARLHGRPGRREDRDRPPLRPPVRHRRERQRPGRHDHPPQGLRPRRAGDGRGQLQGAAVHGRLADLGVRRDGPRGRGQARHAPRARSHRGPGRARTGLPSRTCKPPTSTARA